MTDEKIPIHYVCTHEEAKELINKHDKFWVSNCGCRESNEKGCQQSRIDVCLMWNVTDPGSGSGKKGISHRDTERAEKKKGKKKFSVTSVPQWQESYGCGLCVGLCPLECIKMEKRK